MELLNLDVMKTPIGFRCFFQIILDFFTNLCFYVFILKSMFTMLSFNMFYIINTFYLK